MESSEFITVKMYDLMLGMVDNMPAYRIDHRALASLLNIRVEQGELQTARGRAKVNSGAMAGSGNIQGLGVGQRTDGTTDLIVATSASYWKLDGNTKILLNKFSRGSISAVNSPSAYGVNTKFQTDATVSHRIYMSADGYTEWEELKAIHSQTILTIKGSWGGATSGPYFWWLPVTNSRTRIRKWLGRWFFCNGTDRLSEWDSSLAASGQYRDLGAPSGISHTVSAITGANALCGVYHYKVCYEDNRSRYGNPGPAFSAQNTATYDTNRITFSAVPYYVAYHRIYRTAKGGSTYYYLTKVHVSAAAYNDGATDASITGNELAPTLNYKPPTGVQDFIVFRDRMFVMIGSQVKVLGLPPLDAHAGDPPGLFQPEYDPGISLYLGRNRGAQKNGRGFFILQGHLYAAQSDSIWMLVDTSWDPKVWRFVEVLPNIGCESQWTIDTDGEYAYWLGRKNGRLTVFRWDGVSQPDPIGTRVEGTLATILTPSACAGGCGHGYYRLSFSGSVGNRELEWNSDTGRGGGAWCLRTWQNKAFAHDSVSAYGGGSTGFVYQLEKGLTDGGSSMTYQADFPAVSEPQGMETIRDYPKVWNLLKTELQAISGISGMSAYYAVDGAAMVYMSAAVGDISASANRSKIQRAGMPAAAHGRDCQIRLKISGTTCKFKIRGLVLRGLPQMGIEKINSSGGSL